MTMMDVLTEYADGREIPDEARRYAEQCNDLECECLSEAKALIDECS